MIDLLKQLIATPSVSREETVAADLLENFIKGKGLVVHRKGNNLWAETKLSIFPLGEGRGETILLNAHIDTVKPSASWTRNPFSPTQEGDKLYGLGSNDDGGSLVALLAVFLYFADKYDCVESTVDSCRLIFSATAEEEVSGKNGIEIILDDIGHIDFGIIGEPTGMKMAVAERGLMVLDCTAKGKSGHAAYNEGINAIYQAIENINWFRTFEFPKVSETLGQVKMTVTMVNAGSQHNVIPDACGFVVDVRSNDCYSNQEILNIIKANVKCDVKERSTRLNSSGISTQHPFIQKGVALGLESFGSMTLSNQALLTFPTVKMGPGDSTRSHTADEYIKISEIEEAINIFKKLLE